MGIFDRPEGTMNGCRFRLKPTPINFNKYVEQRAELLQGWMKENKPVVYEKLFGKEKDLGSLTDEELVSLNDWLEDEEFRAKYLQFMADACMEFFGEPKPSEALWKSESLQFEVVETAFDFFTKMRLVT